MTYELHVLTTTEQTLVIPVDNLREVDILVPILGNRMSEVENVRVIAKSVTGDVVLHDKGYI